MHIRISRFLLALALSVTMVPMSALADKGHGNDGKHTDRDDNRDRDDRGRHDRDHDRDDRLRHDRDHDRDDHRNHFRNNGDRPPGWSHGKKTGWGDCNLPPGQAKKNGCHGTDHHRGDGDHDRDDRNHRHGKDRR